MAVGGVGVGIAISPRLFVDATDGGPSMMVMGGVGVGVVGVATGCRGVHMIVGSLLCNMVMGGVDLKLIEPAVSSSLLVRACLGAGWCQSHGGGQSHCSKAHPSQRVRRETILHIMGWV